MARIPVPVELRLEIADFLAREAELLDDRQLTAWLALFADDARYAVRLREPPRPPSSADRGEGIEEGSGAALLFEDDKEFLTLRVRRLESRLAHAERPPSITRHLLTNVIVEPAEGDAVDVRASFVVYQVRPGLADQLFFGQRQDRLRQVAGEWRIVRRLVTLDQNPLPRTLTIFF
jgi:3-phenylpropionate/cinnamic acid dioxygenase small subunit